jgi:nitroreductase
MLNLIKKRRSIRKFSSKKVERKKIMDILEAGRWAPSGYNSQPWRFYIVRNRKEMDKFASYCNEWDKRTIKNSNLCILVYADKKSIGDDEKDNQSIGACIENMALEIDSLGLGACWICGILKNRNKVNKLLRLSSRYQLKALIALGYPAEKPKIDRIKLSKLILGEN